MAAERSRRFTAAGLTGTALPGLGAGAGSLAAQAGGAAGGGSPVPSAPVPSRWPAGPGGPGGGGSGRGPGGSAGGNSGRGLSGGAAALISALMLMLLRLARRAAVKPVWRSYLPEVPPA